MHAHNTDKNMIKHSVSVSTRTPSVNTKKLEEKLRTWVTEVIPSANITPFTSDDQLTAISAKAYDALAKHVFKRMAVFRRSKENKIVTEKVTTCFMTEEDVMTEQETMRRQESARRAKGDKEMRKA